MLYWHANWTTCSPKLALDFYGKTINEVNISAARIKDSQYSSKQQKTFRWCLLKSLRYWLYHHRRVSLACVYSNRLHLTLSSCKCLIIWDRPFKDIGYWKFNSIRILATIHFDGAISSPISRLLLIGYYRIRHFLHVPPLRWTNNHFLKTAVVLSTDSKTWTFLLFTSISACEVYLFSELVVIVFSSTQYQNYKSLYLPRVVTKLFNPFYIFFI